MEKLLKDTQAYRLLKKEYTENACSHAYLLQFGDGRNLRFALKLLAKVLFGCDESGYLDEEEQRREKLIDEESFSDCLFFPLPGKKLSVEDAEIIREECLISPVEGERKVIVIGDFAEANTQTQNKLLKLLEEPPQGVIFLLGATSSFSILPTVLSRVKRLEIQPFDIEETAKCLARIYEGKADNKAIEFCAASSGGIVGEAQNIYEGGYHKTLTESVFELCLANDAKLPLLLKQIGETKYKKELLSLIRIVFRDALLIKTGNGKAVLLRSEKERLTQVAVRYSAFALLRAQEEILEAEKQVQFNAVFPQCLGLTISKIRKGSVTSLG